MVTILIVMSVLGWEVTNAEQSDIQGEDSLQNLKIIKNLNKTSCDVCRYGLLYGDQLKTHIKCSHEIREVVSCNACRSMLIYSD